MDYECGYVGRAPHDTGQLKGRAGYYGLGSRCLLQCLAIPPYEKNWREPDIGPRFLMKFAAPPTEPSCFTLKERSGLQATSGLRVSEKGRLQA